MSKFRLIGSAVLLCASLAFMGANGCSGTPLHQAEVAAGSIAASLHTAATTNHTDTLETPAERTQVANYIVQAVAANDAFLGVLKSAEASGTPSPAAITAAFQSLVARVNDLQSLGVLHISNPQAQANFAVVISSIQASLATLESLYPSLTMAHAGRGGGGVVAALTLSATEIEELIALAVSAGSALVPKLLALRGETDAQILAEAEVDDEDAEEIAEGDGAEAPSTGAAPPAGS